MHTLQQDAYRAKKNRRYRSTINGMPKNLLCKPELQASFKFNREKTISDNYVGRFENV